MSDSPRLEGKPSTKPVKPAPVTAKWCPRQCGQGNSVAAKRMATAILEVLAGMRTPTQAAEALGMSVMRYYQVEARAVQGLVTACEDGRRRDPERALDKEVRGLRRQQERLQRELGRQQALARMAQRSLGLAAPAMVGNGKAGAKKRRRRPVARGLRMVEQLRQPGLEVAAAAQGSVVAQTV